MNGLLLCHRYFHFSRKAWDALWAGRQPALEELSVVFREELFAPRALRSPFPLSFPEAIARHQQTCERDLRLGVRAILDGDPEYPEALARYIPDERRPAALYLRGRDLPSEQDSVAVVGTRHPSAEGMENAASFAAYFSLANLRIVSGLARGVDTTAHRQNLRQGTVAVLGSSVTEIYPAENQPLAEEILKYGGTLVSPFPSGQAPLPGNFPQRNEIIAALTAGTLVVEGAEKSGAAITGKQALAMGKSVVALACDFRSPFGRGALRLQQAGAEFVANEREAVEALFARLGGAGPPPPEREKSKGGARPFTAAKFCESFGGDLPASLSALQEGILLGKILHLGPDRYRWNDAK